MSFVLALDQGTTSSRAIVFDRAGAIRAVAQQEFKQHYPQPGWVEHDPTEIWATQSGVLAEALAKAGIAETDLAAIGIANQRETTVLWERASGRPVAPAIVWQDRRTADECARLRDAGHEAEITRRTGLRLDPYFSGTKLAWLLRHVPGARARAERGELAFDRTLKVNPNPKPDDDPKIVETLGKNFLAKRLPINLATIRRLIGQIREEYRPLLDWMRERIHRHGMRHRPADLIRHATGEAPSPRHLAASLRKKYGELYGF